MSGDARLSPEAVIIYNRAIDTDIEEVLANGVSGSSLEEAGASAEIILDIATIEPRLCVPYTLWSPSLALPAWTEKDTTERDMQYPGVICKRGWSADSDIDREMEVASRVYTQDVERMYEAKIIENHGSPM